MNETTFNWNLLLEEFDNSQMSARAFALSKGIKPASLHWQIKKRANHSAKNAITKCDEPIFVPVHTKETTPYRKASLSLSIGDISINIESGFDPQLLYDVIQVLKTIC